MKGRFTGSFEKLIAFDLFSSRIKVGFYSGIQHFCFLNFVALTPLKLNLHTIEQIYIILDILAERVRRSS